jgi:hypothetical protein
MVIVSVVTDIYVGHIHTISAYKAMDLLRLHSDTALWAPAYPMPINP